MPQLSVTALTKGTNTEASIMSACCDANGAASLAHVCQWFCRAVKSGALPDAAKRNGF
jgi:hypothetical protein